MTALPLLVIALAASARAATPKCSGAGEMPAAHGHAVRLFEVRKDKNPQNVLVLETYADDSCRLVGGAKDKSELIGMHWRMAAGTAQECVKPTHPRIQSETLKTLKVTSLSSDRRTLKIDITQLDKLKHDLPSREAEVTLSGTGGRCAATVAMPLGKAEGGGTLKLTGLDAKGKYRMGVPRKEVKELALVGTDSSGKARRVVYRGK